MKPSGIVSSLPSHPEALWFADAGLGLMIHWGIAALHGKLDLSWAMIANTPYDRAGAPHNKITPRDYWALADRFAPQCYDPDAWLAPAAAAGFRYAVMTAMHHDGYTLWPSRHSSFGVQSTPGGRDLIGPYVAACRRHGLKVGIYLSPPDWYFDREYMSFNYETMGSFDADKMRNGGIQFDIDHKPTQISQPPPEHEEARRRLFHARVRELLTLYGRIDILWFDGGTWDNEVRDIALSLQPHLVINSRSCAGHFESTECKFPTAPATTWLETVHCWQSCDVKMPNGAPVEVWGYLATENYKSAQWVANGYRLLRQLGGNFLVNVSPRADGTLPDIVYDRFAELREELREVRQALP